MDSSAASSPAQDGRNTRPAEDAWWASDSDLLLRQLGASPQGLASEAALAGTLLLRLLILWLPLVPGMARMRPMLRRSRRGSSP